MNTWKTSSGNARPFFEGWTQETLATGHEPLSAAASLRSESGPEKTNTTPCWRQLIQPQSAPICPFNVSLSQNFVPLYALTLTYTFFIWECKWTLVCVCMCMGACVCTTSPRHLVMEIMQWWISIILPLSGNCFSDPLTPTQHMFTRLWTEIYVWWVCTCACVPVLPVVIR